MEIIRTEIIRVLNENGRTRGTELVKRVNKKTGNEKMIYREITSLVELGEIEKIVHSKSHIEYELIHLSDSVNNQLKEIYNELEVTLSEFKKFHEKSPGVKKNHYQRIKTTIHFIHTIQSVESMMRLLSYYPAFKKDKMFSQISRKITDCWEKILEFILHQPEEEFLNDVLENIRIPQISSKINN